MISVAPGTKVHLACQPVSMRLGFDGLAARVSQMRKRKPTPTFRLGLGLSRLRAVLDEAVRDGRERVLL